MAEVLHISPRCSLSVPSLGLSQSCSFVWGQQRQGCVSGSFGVGTWLWGAHLQSGGVSHPGTQPWKEPGVGECRRLWLSWELQKLLCPELELKAASFSLPKHLLSCTLPLPCSISGHGNV